MRIIEKVFFSFLARSLRFGAALRQKYQFACPLLPEEERNT
jgi:hypothetical protein